MLDLIVSVPDHCLSFYLVFLSRIVVSGEGSGIRLHLFLVIAFSSTLFIKLQHLFVSVIYSVSHSIDIV